MNDRIYDYLRSKATNGRVRIGTRTIAADLGVHRYLVIRALTALRDDGRILRVIDNTDTPYTQAFTYIIKEDFHAAQ